MTCNKLILEKKIGAVFFLDFHEMQANMPKKMSTEIFKKLFEYSKAIEL